MKTAMLPALGFLLVSGWPQDGARAQTVPPVSLAPPKASVARAGPKSSPAAAQIVPGANRAPSNALDYDGFSVGSEDEQPALPTGSRAARNGVAAGSSVDPDDEALKRKLIICQHCK